MKILTILTLLSILAGKPHPEPDPPPARRSITILQVTFSPDGRMLATTGLCRPIQLWNATSGNEVRRLAKKAAWVGTACFTPDGKFLVSTDRTDSRVDDTIRLYPVTGQGEPRVVGRAGGDRHWVTGISLSKDGKTLASVAGYGPVMVWDVEAGRALHQFPNKLFRASVAISPNAELVVSTSQSEELVRLWKADTGEELPSLSYRAGKVAFSPDGRMLAVNKGRTLRVLDVMSRNEVRSLETGAVSCIVFGPDGKTIATGTGHSVEVWDASTGAKLKVKRTRGQVTSIAFSPSGASLAAGCYEPGSAHVWNIANGKELFYLDLPPNES